MKKHSITIMLISVLVLFNSCENISETTTSKFALWAEGTQLRGANIYQRRVYPELDGSEFMGNGLLGPPYTLENLTKLAKYGANYVNISHPGIFSEDPPYNLDSQVLSHLANLVELAAQADLYVVISFRTGPGRSEFTFFWGEDGDWFDASYYNDLVWKNKAAQDAWVTMWQYAADYFRDNPVVVGYDLMVEPNSNDVWFDIWEPDEFYANYSNTLYDWNQLHPRISSAIRNVDSETPILIGGLSYSSVDWLPYIIPNSDTKTVYMFHQYQPFEYTHQEVSGSLTYPGYINLNWLQNLLNQIDIFRSTNNTVVACNEYGLVRWVPGAAQFMDDQMNIFESKGINYALWEWATDHGIYTSEVNAFNFRFGPDPNNTSELSTSSLIEVIKKYWAQNTARPSNTNFR